MKATLTALLLLSLIVGFQSVTAQCNDNVLGILDANKAKMVFQNNGSMFWDRFSPVQNQIPMGSGMTTNHSGSLWIAGLDPQGGLHTSVAGGRNASSDWFAGPARTAAAFTCTPTIQTTTDILINGILRLRNGKILVLTETEALVYDLITRQLLTVTLPAPRTALTAIELLDGRVMLVGDQLYPTKNPVLFLDALTYAVMGGPTLQWFHKESSMDLLDNGKVLIAGVVGCEVYDPVTNISTQVPDMLWPRMKHATVKLPNGDILAVGGGASLNGVGATIVSQYFDDTLGYWFPAATMSEGRQRARAITMPGGKIFICAGSDLPATDIYDPVTNTVSPGAPLDYVPTVPGFPGFTPEQMVAAIDSHTVLIGCEFNGYSVLYKFDIYSGQTEYILWGSAGEKLLLLSPTSALVLVDDAHRLQYIDFERGLQNIQGWQQIWKLNRTEIDQFKADFLANTVNFSQYPQIETWPAHGDVSLGEDRNLAPFVDVNQDGRYRPAIDGDYPCIVGDQALWWVFNDQGPHAASDGPQLGVQIEAMAYAIDCGQTTCPDTSMDYTTFLHLEITNRSDTAYHAVYLSNQQDFGIGYDWDDYLASDSSLHLAMGYNADNQDDVYGAGPPAWGATVLPNGHQGEMSGTMTWTTQKPYDDRPAGAASYYNYMRNIYLDGEHLVSNGFDGHPSTGAGPPTNFIYPSTNGACNGAMTGWNEFTAGNFPFWRHFLQNVGPFDLQPGDETQLDLAFVYARDSSNLLSVCKLQSSTATIRTWWQGQLDRSCFSTVVALDAPYKTLGFKVYPNPSGIGQVELDFGGALEDAGIVEVMDVQGRMLKQLALPQGAVGTRLALHDLPAGMYLVRLHAGDRVATQRVILE
jgi:hypothetical protein